MPREEVRLDGSAWAGCRARRLLAASAFVPLWSSGILGDAPAIRHGLPFAATGFRLAAVALLLAPLTLAWRAPAVGLAAAGGAAPRGDPARTGGAALAWRAVRRGG